MSNRFKVLGGSLAGAFAIHIALVACGTTGNGPSGTDGGHEGGVLDAVVDVLSDTAQELADVVLDAEVRDAHAGGDAGADGGAPPRTCDCIPPLPESSFSLTIDRGRGEERPEADYSRASASGTVVRVDDGRDVVFITAGFSFNLRALTPINVSCEIATLPDRTILRQPVVAPSPLHEARCATELGGRPRGVDGVTVSALTDTEIEVRIAAIPVTFYRPNPMGGSNIEDGAGALRNVVIRTRAPSARFLTIPRAYRP